MALQTTTTLKTYFNKGDKPTETHFHDMLSSYLNLTDSGTVLADTTFSSRVSFTGHASGNLYQHVSTVIDNTIRGSAITEAIAVTGSATYPSSCIIPISCSAASKNITIVLPPVDDTTYGAGTRFTFVGYGGSAAAANSTVAFASASSLYGDIFTSSSIAIIGHGGQLARSLNGDSSITWAGTKWTKGTKVEAVCDGQNWHLSGHTGAVSASVAIA